MRWGIDSLLGLRDQQIDSRDPCPNPLAALNCCWETSIRVAARLLGKADRQKVLRIFYITQHRISFKLQAVRSPEN